MKPCSTVDLEEREREIFEELRDLAKRYDVERIVLFGSRARRTHHRKSDIDLAVHGCRNFQDFSFDVDEKVRTLLRFDLIDMDDEVTEELRKEILRDGIIIYEKI